MKMISIVMNKFYVYVLLDSRKPGKYQYKDVEFEYEPFYVGKGCGNRHKAHTCECNMKYNKHKIAKINKIKNSEYSIVSRKVYCELSERDALIQENELIKKIGRTDNRDGPLTNKNSGGLENNGFGEEYRKAIAKGNAGKVRSLETRQKISKTMTGIKRSVEYKNMLSKNRQGINNPGAKKYLFTDPKGKTYICEGAFKKFVNEHKLEYSIMRYILKNQKKTTRGCSFGWFVEYLN